MRLACSGVNAIGMRLVCGCANAIGMCLVCSCVNAIGMCLKQGRRQTKRPAHVCHQCERGPATCNGTHGRRPNND
tara:strand:+ start:256 stop:480 length:225 start_codon:yes stop_codon:yes gene_type:complete